MKIFKNKWFWIVVGIILLIIIMKGDKNPLSPLLGNSDNYVGDKKKPMFPNNIDGHKPHHIKHPKKSIKDLKTNSPVI